MNADSHATGKVDWLDNLDACDVPEWFGCVPAGCDVRHWVPHLLPEELESAASPKLILERPVEAVPDSTEVN